MEFFIFMALTLPVKLLLLTWIEKVVKLFKKSAKEPAWLINQTSLRCLDLYRKCKRGLSSYFAVTMAMDLSVLIISLYLSLNFLLGQKNILNIPKITFMCSTTSLSMYLIFWILIITTGAENCHRALTDLTQPLRRRKVETVSDPRELAEIENIINDIESVGPFTGEGFFDVKKTTLTAMMGSTVTYLIVLIQFKTSEAIS